MQVKTPGYILFALKTVLFVCIWLDAPAQDVFTGINYQAVAVDHQGKAIAGVDIVGNKIPEREIAVKFEILAGHPDGAVVYQEYHATNTDQFGMFSLIIGQGDPTDEGQCSALADIPWEADRYFLRVYLNIHSSALNPDQFTLASVEALSAVPYAMHARTADRVSDNALQDIFTPAYTSGDTLFFTNTKFVVLDPDDEDADARNELQILSLSNDTIYLSEGGFVKLPSGFDGDFHSLAHIPAGLADGDDDTHLSEAEVDAYVQNNGYLLAEADGSVTNELQTLSLSGDTISLSNGGFVKIPRGFDGDFASLANIPPDLADGDDDTHLSEAEVDAYVQNNGYLTVESDGSVTNELQTLSVSGDTIHLTDGGFVKIPQGFNGDFASLSNIPPDLADGDDDTHLSEADVDAYVANNGYLTAEVDGSVTNELQFLSMSNDTIFLTNGGFVKLPAGFDGNFSSLSNVPPGLADGDDNTHLSEAEVDAYVANNGYLTAEIDGSPTNELQVLSISNDTIFLSDGGFARLPAAFTGNYDDLSNKPDLSQYLTAEQDGSATNEIQSLSVSAYGDTLYLSQSNFIIIPGVSNFNLPGVSDIEGNTYSIVRIGTQVWMSENLKTTRFSNGDPIPTTTPPNADISAEINPIYQWPANGDEINVPAYGRLYTGYVATDPRNVCPAGWHVPTYADWNGLINYLGGMTEAGGPLKEVGTTHWQSPNSGATNASGFMARGAGFRHVSSFFYMLQRAHFWSSTVFAPGQGYQYYLFHGSAAVGGVANDSYYKGFSIRCIQD